MFHGMDEKEHIKKLRNRSSGSQLAHRVMRKREEVTGEQIYFGEGITKKRRAKIRAGLKKALARQALAARKKLHLESTSQ